MKKLNQDASDGTNLRTDLPIVLSGTALILTYVLTDLKSNHLFKVIIVSWNVFLIGWGAFSLWRGYRDDLNRSRTILRLVLSSTAIAYVIIVGIVSSTKPLERDQHLILLALEGGLLTIVGILLNGALIQPQYLNAMISIDRKAEESPPPLVRQIDELEAMRAKVQQLMDDEKLFLSPRLTLEDLADKVGAPVYRVRYLLNQHLGYENFAGFLNPYRLRYAAALLMDPARNDDKIFAIALESGFGSLAPFNKAFKALYGVTPSEYRQKQVNASAAT